MGNPGPNATVRLPRLGWAGSSRCGFCLQVELNLLAVSGAHSATVDHAGWAVLAGV